MLESLSVSRNRHSIYNKISLKNTNTKKSQATHTHTHKDPTAALSLSLSLFSLKLEALVYPIARNSISGSRRSLRRLHVSAAAAAASATAAAAAAARVAVVAGLWKINCTSTALPPLLLAMRICHLHNVCVDDECVCLCASMCAQKKKKAIEEKHLQILYLRQFSFIHATAAHVSVC